jgi:glucose-1-phosphate thymidylyltransferase
VGEVKAVILARGLARRMREREPGVDLPAPQAEAAAAGLKAMMPVGAAEGGAGVAAPRPFLDYVMDALANAGYTEIGLVIGPEHSSIRDRYTREEVPHRLRLSWLIQQEPRGTADAVLAAEAWVEGGPFVVLNADNLYPVDVLRALRELDGPGLPVFERDDLVRSGNIPADRVASFALVSADADGYLTAILEKPGSAAMAEAGPRALVSMNCWRFDARIFDACRDVPLSPRGELELPMAVALAIERGVHFRTVAARGEVLDLSRRADVEHVTRRLSGRSPRL